MTQVIILTGKKQSGKDTSCDYLRLNLFKGFKAAKFSFADPLKEFLINTFGLTHDQCYGSDQQKSSPTSIKWKDLPFNANKIDLLFQELRNTNSTPQTSDYLKARELMQIFGTEICREMYPDCWALSTFNKILNSNLDYALIADARFPNEIDIFYDSRIPKPIIIRLKRDNFNSNHISETALDTYPFKYIIDNQNMSLIEKNNAVENIVRGAIA